MQSAFAGVSGGGGGDYKRPPVAPPNTPTIRGVSGARGSGGRGRGRGRGRGGGGGGGVSPALTPVSSAGEYFDSSAGAHRTFKDHTTASNLRQRNAEATVQTRSQSREQATARGRQRRGRGGSNAPPQPGVIAGRGSDRKLMEQWPGRGYNPSADASPSSPARGGGSATSGGRGSRGGRDSRGGRGRRGTPRGRGGRSSNASAAAGAEDEVFVQYVDVDDTEDGGGGGGGEDDSYGGGADGNWLPEFDDPSKSSLSTAEAFDFATGGEVEDITHIPTVLTSKPKPPPPQLFHSHRPQTHSMVVSATPVHQPKASTDLFPPASSAVQSVPLFGAANRAAGSALADMSSLMDSLLEFIGELPLHQAMARLTLDPTPSTKTEDELTAAHSDAFTVDTLSAAFQHVLSPLGSSNADSDPQLTTLSRALEAALSLEQNELAVIKRREQGFTGDNGVDGDDDPFTSLFTGSGGGGGGGAVTPPVKSVPSQQMQQSPMKSITLGSPYRVPEESIRNSSLPSVARQNGRLTTTELADAVEVMIDNLSEYQKQVRREDEESKRSAAAFGGLISQPDIDPETGRHRLKVDRAAASRFILHALREQRKDATDMFDQKIGTSHRRKWQPLRFSLHSPHSDFATDMTGHEIIKRAEEKRAAAAAGSGSGSGSGSLPASSLPKAGAAIVLGTPMITGNSTPVVLATPSPAAATTVISKSSNGSVMSTLYPGSEPAETKAKALAAEIIRSAARVVISRSRRTFSAAAECLLMYWCRLADFVVLILLQ